MKSCLPINRGHTMKNTFFGAAHGHFPKWFVLRTRCWDAVAWTSLWQALISKPAIRLNFPPGKIGLMALVQC